MHGYKILTVLKHSKKCTLINSIYQNTLFNGYHRNRTMAKLNSFQLSSTTMVLSYRTMDTEM